MNPELLERLESLSAQLKRTQEKLESAITVSYQRADEIETLKEALLDAEATRDFYMKAWSDHGGPK